jgi:hypothetical protein
MNPAKIKRLGFIFWGFRKVLITFLELDFADIYLAVEC